MTQPTKTRTHARRNTTEPTQSVSAHSEHRLHKEAKMKRTEPGLPRQLSVKIVTSSGDVMCSSRLPCHHLSCQFFLSSPSSAFLFRWLLFPSMPIIIWIWLPLHISTNLSNAHENQPVTLCRAFWSHCRKQPDFYCLFFTHISRKVPPTYLFSPFLYFSSLQQCCRPRAQTITLLLGNASVF